MKNDLKSQLESAFNAGTNWKEKWYKDIQYIGSDGTHKEPDFKKYFESLKLSSCDNCGDYFAGKKYPFYDENHKKQPGLTMCLTCYALSR